MSERIALAFCVHSHQPVGNFHEVFEQGANDCYMPFLEMLQSYPNIRMTLHYTGPLLEWLEEHRPEFFDLLSEMTGRGQVEILGGGFYEPILSVIPHGDARAQILKSAEYSLEKFGSRPSGIWCAERIWEPALPEKISGTGMEYTLLDDSHFLSAGLSPEDVHGYYMTEREGFPLKVFPIDMQLRYMIPFKEPHETVNYLRRLRSRGVRLVTYGDDGEKFGMWPGTRKWVYDDGWLRRFFDTLNDLADEIEIMPLNEAIRRFSAQGRVYLPTATYQEMMEWSLLAEPGRYYEDLVHEAKHSHDWDRKRAFLRGGMWDNFLAKYDEVNRMHKKMLKVSAMLRSYESSPRARQHVMMGQCNCPYWHGLFGGVYVRGLRHAIYENLLKAEEIIDHERLKEQSWLIEREDYDLDGSAEVMVSGRKLNFYIAPHSGAAVVCLEYKPRHYSLSNILMRHPEIYHRKITEQVSEGVMALSHEPVSIHDQPTGDLSWLKSLLIYDDYPKHSFMTHCLSSAPDLASILSQNRVLASLSAQLPMQEVEQNLEHELVFKGSIDGFDLTKRFLFTPDQLRLVNDIESDFDRVNVVLEFNLMVLSGERPKVDGHEMEHDRGIFKGQRLMLADSGRDVQVDLSVGSEMDIVVVPIECASQSESGFEKTFQGWSVYFCGTFSRVPELTFRVGPCQS